MKKTIRKVVALTTGIAATLAFGTSVTAQMITVQSGDTLWELSQKYHVSVDEIKTANRLNSDMLYVGQTLHIPAKENTHTVQSGETLWIISQKYNITVTQLKAANNLTSNTIYAGQKLTIPSNGTTYTVQPGDSLWKISQKFGVSISAIQSQNNLSSHYIYPGQVLTIQKTAHPQAVQVNTANLADKMIATAKQYMGTPYVWGGTSPSGFDCSGFLHYVFLQNGVTIPRTVATIYEKGTHVESPSRGDLVFFETYKEGPSHAGIYLGNGQFIHASSSKGVTISSMDNPYWSPRYLGAKSYY